MQLKPSSILIVEDHPATRRFLADNLAADGYEPLEADTARDGRRLMASQSPDLAIIDLGLPDRDGLELLRDVREADRLVSKLDPQLPLIVLSGRAGELDRVRGFERGADDYLVKPFSYPELRARIVALLRRSSRRPSGPRLQIGPLEVDPLCVRSGSTVDRFTSPRRSSRCCGRWPRSPPACSRAKSCCAESGAFSRSAPHGHWTRTPRACARS